MPASFFVSDLHGQTERYLKLFDRIAAERPAAVFFAGDLLPHALDAAGTPEPGFLDGFLLHHLSRLREHLGDAAPRNFVILGNDDPRTAVAALRTAGAAGVLDYVHERRATLAGYGVYGYACVPPTPFLNKDWERYDVSRYVDPGCVSPEEGFRSVAVDAGDVRYGTIQQDLDQLAAGQDLERSIWLFHSPPYQTALDRAALDGQMIDHVPLDVHVGSIAIRRFIAARQPRITLHGHIHESARLTGRWREQMGRTLCLSAAHDGPELALVRFDPDAPDAATRELL